MHLAVALLAATLPAAGPAPITAGLPVPVTSPAYDQSPSAGVDNAAGLSFHHGLSLRYVHDAIALGKPSQDNLAGNGLYLAAGTGGFGASLSLEWLNGSTALGGTGTNHRTTWALAFGSGAASIGAALKLYGGDTEGIDNLASGDLGFMFRPDRFFSLGLVVRDITQPTLRGTTIPRDYVLAVGARPFGDWLTLAINGDVLEERDAFTGRPGGWQGFTLGGTAEWQLVQGLALFGSVAGTSHVHDSTVAQIGLSATFDHGALYSSALFSPGTDGHTEPGVLVAADIGTARERPAINVRPPPRMALVDLGDVLATPSGFRIFPGEPHDRILDAVTGLMAAAREPGLAGVILRMGDLPGVAWGNAFELRQAMLDVRAHGKKVIVLLTAAGDVEYDLASGADRIWCAPEAALLVNGLQAHALFFGKTLSDIGVTVEAVRIGKYKNAPDELIGSQPSAEQKEVTASLLDSVFNHYVADVTSSRKMTPEAFKAALDVGILSPDRAMELGLIDAIVSPDDVEDEAGKLLGAKPTVFEAGLGPRTWMHWGEPPVIAVVPVKGLITMGSSGGDPLGFVETTGAETVVRALEQAAGDPQVRAIVLRVDSGGGDSQASDIIYRAVMKAAKKKPVVASMGDTAASGGYYAAAGAAKIFAAPTTITGSIGIFAMKPAIGRLLGMLDVGTYSEHRGEHAAIYDIYEPWTSEERVAMQTFIATSYKHFLESVSKTRPLTPDQVDAVGQGRVWTGEQAKERKLVDDLGGLAAALDSAELQAHVDPDAPIEFRVLEPSGGLLSVPSVASSLPAPLKDLVKAGVPAPLLVRGGSGLWALLPWQIRIQ